MITGTVSRVTLVLVAGCGLMGQITCGEMSPALAQKALNTRSDGPARAGTATPAQPAASAPEQGCAALYPGGTVAFTGLNPAIEQRVSIKKFKPGQIVEIDFTTMPEAAFRQHVAELQALPARVSVYLPGGHCNIENKDCDALERAAIPLGTTGSWNWDKDERRILNIIHPVSLERMAKGAERAWRLGANYVRVDNLHNPAGTSNPRTAAQIKTIYDAIFDVEDHLRQVGVIPPDRPTGVVAHNNLEVWDELVRTGQLRRPPVFLTSERTAQLAYKGQGYKGDAAMKAGELTPLQVDEITAGRKLAQGLGIPYTIAEFQISHDLGGKPASTYQLPAKYVTELAALPGVTEVIVIPSETHYVGRGKSLSGRGPRSLAAKPFPSDARRLAMACLER